VDQGAFCKGCHAFFELIDPFSRCPYCFSENEGKRPCLDCIQKKKWQIKMASSLDYLGPVSTLIKKLKYGYMPYLAKLGAAFMLLQLERLKWPLPDIIVPVPSRHWFYGTNHAYLLGSFLAHSIKRPCINLIKRKAGDLSQARLSKRQREELPQKSFRLKKNAKIEDQIILLVDDVITTGTTIRHCAEALADGFPAKLYALSLARSTDS
jgi:ComF family protein